MFYSQHVLAKKGPLGKVWLASVWPKRLTKTQIFQADIVSYVDNIVNPSAPLALRLSGHLMLGVIRIYERKAKYLLTDCNDALVKLKMAFKSGTVDLTTKEMIAPYASITMADNLNSLDLDMSLEYYEDENPLNDSVNVSRREDITLGEDQFSHSLIVDSAHFEDIGNETAHTQMDQSIEVARAGVSMNEGDFSLGNVDQELEDAIPSNSKEESRLSLASARGEAGLDDLQEQFDGYGDDYGEDPMAMTFDNFDQSQGLVPNVDIDMDALEQPTQVTDANPLNAKTYEPIELKPISAPAIKKMSKKRRQNLDAVTELTGAEIKSMLADTSNLVRTQLPRPMRLTRTEALRKRKASLPVDVLFVMPSTFTLDKSLWYMFEHSMHTEGAKRRRLMGDDDANAEMDDGVEVAREEQPIVNDPSLVMDQEDIGMGDDYDPYGNEYPDDAVRDDADGAILDPSLDVTAQSGVDVPVVGMDDAPASEHGSDAEDHEGEDLKTSEEYQGRGWSKKTVIVMKELDRRFGATTKPLSFDTMSQKRSRLDAANLFFELCVLKTRGCIEVDQPEPFADITVTKTDELSAQLLILA